MSTEPPGVVKVRFRLQRDDEGWPPVESEGVWAEPLGGDRYRVDNIPWFARNVAADDIVRARTFGDDTLWATERVVWSGRLAIRVVPFRDGPLQGSLQAVLDAFRPLGVSGEGGAPAYQLVALDVPPDADWRAVKDALRAGRADGSWDFEEGCVSEEWKAL